MRKGGPSPPASQAWCALGSQDEVTGGPVGAGSQGGCQGPMGGVQEHQEEMPGWGPPQHVAWGVCSPLVAPGRRSGVLLLLVSDTARARERVTFPRCTSRGSDREGPHSFHTDQRPSCSPGPGPAPTAGAQRRGHTAVGGSAGRRVRRPLWTAVGRQELPLGPRLLPQPPPSARPVSTVPWARRATPRPGILTTCVSTWRGPQPASRPGQRKPGDPQSRPLRTAPSHTPPAPRVPTGGGATSQNSW